MFRQGDVLLIPVAKLPGELEAIESKVVVEGNQGHDHCLAGKADLLQQDSDLYIKVEDSASLTHDEHRHIELPPGSYQVRRQRQYHPLRYRPAGD